MQLKRLSFLIVLLAVAVGLAGCAGFAGLAAQATATPSPTAPAATATQTPRPRATATQTRTPVPTNTPSPAPTATPTHTPQPTATRWVLARQTATPEAPAPTQSPAVPTSAAPAAGQATAAQPVPAPAAAGLAGRLVFQLSSGGPIYTMDANGENLRLLTHGLDPALSPDGRQVAFARWDGTARGLYLIGVDGSGERMIFGDQQLKAPAWSADGAHIAFYRQHGRREAELVCYPGFGCFTIPEDPYWRLGIVDVASGEFRDLLSDLHSRSPDFFPAGDRVVYIGDQGLQTTAVDRDEQGVLAKELKLSSPDVSPDGRRIVYMQYVHDHWDLFVANADGANPVALTRIGAFDPRPVNNVAPAWSPDGSSIVFLSDRESGRWRLYVMAADGSQVRLVPGEELAALQFHYDHVDEQVVDWGP